MQVLIIAIFRLFIVVLGVTVIGQNLFFFSMSLLQGNQMPMTAALYLMLPNIIFLVFLKLLWTVPRTILGLVVSDFENINIEKSHIAILVQLVIFIVGFWTFLPLFSDFVAYCYKIAFDSPTELSKQENIKQLSFNIIYAAIAFLAMHQSKTIARWFYSLK